MKNKPAADWYAFHFGSKFAESPDFNPEGLFGHGGTPECYVLYADFCSFTSFFKATENTRCIEPLMTSFYSELRKAIHERSGMLDKFLGDAVIAVWGLHVRENDMIQAVLETCNELAAIANRVAEEWQSRIDLLVEPKGMRIGLSKGPIIVIRRDLHYPGLSILGNPINLASRLQAAATANQLVCSNLVYQDAASARLHDRFQPYKGAAEAAYLEAKNYGAIKAWTMDLKPT